MPQALLRIDAHVEADTPEELREILDNLSIFGSNMDVLFDAIYIVDDSQASSSGTEPDVIRP